MGNVGDKDGEPNLLVKAQSSRDQMIVSESGFTLSAQNPSDIKVKNVKKIPKDPDGKIPNVLEAKEHSSIASINNHRKQERERVYADQVQKIQRQVNSAQRKIEENIQDLLMLKFLDGAKIEDKEGAKVDDTVIAQRKAEQARVKKNIRDWKRKTRKPPPQISIREEVVEPVEVSEPTLPVEEEKDIVEEEVLPECTDPNLGSLPPPPPPRDMGGITFAETAALYDSVFLLAEGGYITVDEEAMIYRMIANSSAPVFESYRSYEQEKDLAKFASDLVALSLKDT